MDFTADGRHALVSCEFGARLIVVDLRRERVLRTIALPAGSMPQDVKLSPDGRTFYVADMMADGVWLIDARRLRQRGFRPTGRGAHGLYPSRDAAACSCPTAARARSACSRSAPAGRSPSGAFPAAARPTWAACRPTAACCGSPAATTASSTASARAPDACCAASAWAAGRTAVRVAPARPLLDRPHRHPPLRRGAGRTLNHMSARILVVDDDPSVLRMLVRTLGAEGNEVEAASDGGAALLAVERRAPDAVVLDVAMPGMDGLAVCRRLRDRGLTAPVLLLTARDAVADRVAGLEAGADYLVKPFAIEELLARLRGVSPRRGQGSSARGGRGGFAATRSRATGPSSHDGPRERAHRPRERPAAGAAHAPSPQRRDARDALGTSSGAPRAVEERRGPLRDEPAPQARRRRH